jgi:curved DNA-binding protein CbpA
MHPYHTLKVPANADSDTIRKAYLEAIRRHPPEHEPERFRLVGQAYSSIKSEDGRLQREIGLHIPASDAFTSPLEAVAAFWKADLDPQPPCEDDFHSFLR